MRSIRFKQFLEKAVGKALSQNEMEEIDKVMAEIKDKKKVKKIYNEKLAGFWKKIVAYENKGEEIKLFEKYLPFRKDLKVLSIGSGLCVYEAFIAQEFYPFGEIVCLDFSEKMNKQGCEIVKKMNVKNVKIIQGNAKKLPFENKRFNVILARRTGLSQYTLIWKDVLKEVRRVLIDSFETRFIYTVQENVCKSLIKLKKELADNGFEFITREIFKEKDGTRIVMAIAGVK